MKKTIPILYAIVAVCCMVLIIFNVMLGKDDMFGDDLLENQQIYPERVERISSLVNEYYFEVDNSENERSDLLFFTNHQYVRVYVNGAVHYTLEEEESFLGKTTGSLYNIVKLPTEYCEIIVEIETIYPQAYTDSYDFYVGNDVEMYREIMWRSSPQIIISILNITFGFMLICYWFVMRRKVKLDFSLFYFGIFATLVGLWTFNETNFSTLIATNRNASSNMGYYLIMLMVIPFVTYVKISLGTQDKIWYRAICIASFIDLIGCTGLHMEGILAFRQTVSFTHLLMVLSLVYLLYGLVCHYKIYGLDYKVKINFLGEAVLAISIFADLAAYYSKFRNTDVVGRFGVLFYVFLLGMENLNDYFRKIDEIRKAAIYKELAITDMLTGLYNRNAFDEWEKNNKDFSNIMVVTFDLNNLKQCNDTMGHAIGDQYIMDAAKIIKDIFGKVGISFRIGGDEFCTIITKADKINMDIYLEELKQSQIEYNARSQDIRMEIACGYAMYESTDSGIEDTRNRADMNMYLDKKAIKNV